MDDGYDYILQYCPQPAPHFNEQDATLRSYIGSRLPAEDIIKIIEEGANPTTALPVAARIDNRAFDYLKLLLTIDYPTQYALH